MVFRVRSYLPNATDFEARQLVPDFSGGHIPAVISSGERARDGFILEQKGLEFDRFRANPVVLLNHDDGSGGMLGGGSSALPIARSRDELRDTVHDITTAVADFDMEDELAVRVLGKIERGLINSTSIRWIPLEHRIERIKRDDIAKSETEPVIVFTRSEVLEWSFVPIPSDTNAVVQRSDGTVAAFCVDDACAMLEPADWDLADDSRLQEMQRQGKAIFKPRNHKFDPMSLVDVVDAAHALIDGRSEPVFTEPEQMAAARLYGLINGRVLATRQLPTRATDETAKVLDELAGIARGAERALTQGVTP